MLVAYKGENEARRGGRTHPKEIAAKKITTTELRRSCKKSIFFQWGYTGIVIYKNKKNERN